MRWSRGLSLLSLTLLVLLNTVNASAESPSQKRPEAQASQPQASANQTQNAETYTTPTVPASKPEDAKQVQTKHPKIANNSDGYIKTQIALVNATERLVNATIGLVVIGAVDVVILAIQIYWLWQTAKATTLALRTDRPVLVVKFVNPKCKSAEGKSMVSSEVYLQNLGKSPAVIVKALSGLRVQHKEPLNLEPPDYSQCLRSWIDQSVISPGVTVSIGIANSLQLTSKEFEHVTTLRWTIVAYGLLSYRDPAFEDEYPITFQWIYRPPREGKPDGDFLLGYDEHQRWK